MPQKKFHRTFKVTYEFMNTNKVEKRNFAIEKDSDASSYSSPKTKFWNLCSC